MENSREVLLAVAGCKSCHGKLSTDNSGEVADAAGDLSSPRGSLQGGSYGSQNDQSNRNLGGSYGGKTDSSSYSTPYYRAPVSGGTYGARSSGEAGSWQGSNSRTNANLNSKANPSYDYNSYNTNRGFNTSPTYQGRYWDSSSPTTTVAPYGYNPQVSQGYSYEGVATSGILTEPELLGQLSDQGKALYLSLPPEAKALALQLASQANYPNKDVAVREARIKFDERRNAMMKNR